MTTLSILTKQEARAAKRAKWVAQGPAIIQRPLLHLFRAAGSATARGRSMSNRELNVASAARRAAFAGEAASKVGDGVAVKALARMSHLGVVL